MLYSLSKTLAVVFSILTIFFIFIALSMLQMNTDSELFYYLYEVIETQLTVLDSGVIKQYLPTILIGLFVCILATSILIILTYKLLKPLKSVISGMESLSNGNHKVRLLDRRHDELGMLISNFNRLAATLDDNHESRRRWLANISHELRTPLTSLNCEIESLEDGLTQFDGEQLKSFRQEVKKLQYLVDDIYELSLSEIGGLRYKFTILNLTNNIKDTVSLFSMRASQLNIDIVFDAKVNVYFKGDSKRITQLFSNLINNSLLYTDAPGKISITIEERKTFVLVFIDDTYPNFDGNPEKLFDPFYRQIKLKDRSKKGGGLGLTICRNIVEAHNGTITAQNSLLGGLLIKIEFPKHIIPKELRNE